MDHDDTRMGEGDRSPDLIQTKTGCSMTTVVRRCHRAGREGGGWCGMWRYDSVARGPCPFQHLNVRNPGAGPPGLMRALHRILVPNLVAQKLEFLSNPTSMTDESFDRTHIPRREWLPVCKSLVTQASYSKIAYSWQTVAISSTTSLNTMHLFQLSANELLYTHHTWRKILRWSRQTGGI